WFDDHAGETLAISDWTLIEFASAMGIQVRSKGIKPEQAHKARVLMETLAADCLQVITPTRRDYHRAAEYLGQHALGLRAGDALHLAIAQNQAAACLYTLDRRLIDAARKLKFRAASPI
ncbi:MAG: type II toxin-antitoxin system VapC family toxin, partial [Lysobacterales bacterium]